MPRKAYERDTRRFSMAFSRVVPEAARAVSKVAPISTVGFVCAGNMALPMVGDSLKDLSADSVRVAARSRAGEFKQSYGVEPHTVEAAAASDVVFVCPKPQVFQKVLSGSPIKSDATVVSIIAGVPSGVIQAVTSNSHVIRCMPNTPATIGRGITGVFKPDGIDPVLNTLEGIQEVSAFGQAFVKGIFQHATVMHSTFGFLMQI